MRRTGQFETMINAYASVQFDEELLNQILRFEVEKAKEKNTACYRVEDVADHTAIYECGGSAGEKIKKKKMVCGCEKIRF